MNDGAPSLLDPDHTDEPLVTAPEASGGSTGRGDRAAEDRLPLIAVLGNPNAGKSTIFNWLTGLSQKVGNYPGVTVERKEGKFEVDDRFVRLVDLPGTYSLSAHSPDELVAVDVLLGRHPGEEPPDLVLHVVDTSNIERNLYLFSQLRELGTPAIIVLNMIDIAQRRGMQIDVDRLAEKFGVPVVVTQGKTGRGISELRAAVSRALSRKQSRLPIEVVVPEALTSRANELLATVGPDAEKRLGWNPHPFELLRALVDRGGSAEKRLVARLDGDLAERIEVARRELETDGSLAALEAHARHQWVRERVRPCLEEAPPAGTRLSERIDRVLTHRVFGLLIFAGVMLFLFQSIFAWATPLMDLIDGGMGALGAAIGTVMPEGVLRSLLVDGVIGGAGSVLIFLPQILILFLFVGILEDCGYMARAAFIMDRLMAWCGLSGKSFIPMLSGFACAIPGIMAARVIEDRRDRITTILVTPLMTCSARLPIYAILIGTFIPDIPVLGGFLGLQAVTLFSLYLLGIVVAVAMAWVFKNTILRGSTPPFVLELPAYKSPSVVHVSLRLLERAKTFIVDAGTIILAISVIVWALAYFPHSADVRAPFALERQQIEVELAAVAPDDTSGREEIERRLVDVDRRESGASLQQSFLGSIGRTVEPAFAPLGWDWRISTAAIASFPAREVVIATLGTIYNLGDDADEESVSLRERLRTARHDDTGELVYTVPVALSVLVFFALCAQCGATLAMIKRETNSWVWASFTFLYMTALAWVGAFAVYQVGSRWWT